MARDDSIFDTGSNSMSRSALSVRVRREAVENATKEVSRALRPALDVIVELLLTEQAKIKNIEYFDIEDMDVKEGYALELMARKKYLKFLKGFQQKVTKALKEYQ